MAAAVDDFDVSGPLPSVAELEERFFTKQLAALEGRREQKATGERRAAEAAAKARGDERALNDMLNADIAAEWNVTGMPGFAKAFTGWLISGQPPRSFAGMLSKASLVEDAAGEVLIPTPLTIDILNVARDVGTLRSLVDVRPETGSKQRVSLLSVAAVGWTKLELGVAATDANVAPAAVAPDPIPVFDLVSLALIGVDELADSPDSAQQSIIDAIGVAIADAEDAAIAAGTGSGQPSGLALAANVALVPAGQKLAVAASNTPTWAQLQTIPWLLPTRFRNNATWLFHPTSAQKVAALTAGTGEGLVWPNPGNPDPRAGGGFLGWPAYVVDGLPDPATAGTGDASIFFADVRSAYRLVDRQRTTVQVLRQRYADLGAVGMLVRRRVGGDLLRPAACAIYTQ